MERNLKCSMHAIWYALNIWLNSLIDCDNRNGETNLSIGMCTIKLAKRIFEKEKNTPPTKTPTKDRYRSTNGAKALQHAIISRANANPISIERNAINMLQLYYNLSAGLSTINRQTIDRHCAPK